MINTQGFIKVPVYEALENRMGTIIMKYKTKKNRIIKDKQNKVFFFGFFRIVFKQNGPSAKKKRKKRLLERKSNSRAK